MYTAKRLLFLFGEYLRHTHIKEESAKVARYEDPIKGYGPKDMGKRGSSRNELYLRAFLRVASHPKFKAYEADVMAVWLHKLEPTCTASQYIIERCSEFEVALDADLEKRGFDPGSEVESAKDNEHALIPISACALALKLKTPNTIHVWINNGLAGELVSGYPAVQKLGAYYYVNYWAARTWQETRGRMSKKSGRSSVNSDRMKKKVRPVVGGSLPSVR